MIIGAALVTLFTVLILGGSNQELIFIDFEKEAKKVVVDESRMSEIKTLSKEFGALEKEYGKNVKSFAKEFKELLGEQETNSEQFVHFLDEMVKYELEADEKYLAIRYKVQDQMLEAEWSQMMENLGEKIDKSGEKTSKALAKYNDNLDDITEKIVNCYVDETAKTKAEKTMATFTLKANDLAKEMLVYDEKEIATLSAYSSKESEIKPVLENYNEQMKGFYSIIFKLHKELAEISTEKDWKKVSKQLQKL